jgi:hypothetical protein
VRKILLFSIHLLIELLLLSSSSSLLSSSHTQGLILAGTECGTLYAYGDGFQYMQPAIVQMDITHILSLSDEKILVCFADNALAIFQLPYLQLLYRLDSSWLSTICGDVTTIHIDESRGKSYAYVGTSEGFVRVLHLLNDFREVEYCITTADSGVTGTMAVSDLQLNPKVFYLTSSDSDHILCSVSLSDRTRSI